MMLLHFLQRILKTLPLTLSSAIEYFAEQASQTIFIVRFLSVGRAPQGSSGGTDATATGSVGSALEPQRWAPLGKKNATPANRPIASLNASLRRWMSEALAQDHGVGPVRTYRHQVERHPGQPLDRID